MPAHGDFVASSDYVIDGDAHVREGRAVQLHRVLEDLGATQRTHLSRFGRVVVHCIRRHELIDELEIAFVECLLEQATRPICWIYLTGGPRCRRVGVGCIGGGHVRPPLIVQTNGSPGAQVESRPRRAFACGERACRTFPINGKRVPATRACQASWAPSVPTGGTLERGSLRAPSDVVVEARRDILRFWSRLKARGRPG